MFIALLTSPYRESGYHLLVKSLQSFMRAGLTEFLLEHEAKVHVYDTESHENVLSIDVLNKNPSLFEIIPNYRKYNLFENTNRALKEGAQCDDWVLLLQDDIIVTKSFFDVALYSSFNAPNDAGLITFFHTFSEDYAPTKVGFWLYDITEFWGEQSILFNSELINSFLVSDPVTNNEKYPHPHKWHDMKLKIFMMQFNDRYRLYGYHPSLVQHIGGEESSIGHKSNRRRTVWFPGESYDAIKTI